MSPKCFFLCMYVQYDLTHSHIILPSGPSVVFFFSHRSIAKNKRSSDFWTNRDFDRPNLKQRLLLIEPLELTLIFLCNFEAVRCLTGGRVIREQGLTTYERFQPLNLMYRSCKRRRRDKFRLLSGVEPLYLKYELKELKIIVWMRLKIHIEVLVWVVWCGVVWGPYLLSVY